MADLKIEYVIQYRDGRPLAPTADRRNTAYVSYYDGRVYESLDFNQNQPPTWKLRNDLVALPRVVKSNPDSLLAYHPDDWRDILGDLTPFPWMVD